MTIKQIAEKAGTSRGTVDRVLNGRGNVNPELAKRILDIAERERYQPNQLAQALIRSRQQLPSSRAIRLSRAKDNITGALKRIMIFFKQDTSFQIRLKRVYYTFRKK